MRQAARYHYYKADGIVYCGRKRQKCILTRSVDKVDCVNCKKQMQIEIDDYGSLVKHATTKKETPKIPKRNCLSCSKAFEPTHKFNFRCGCNSHYSEECEGFSISLEYA